MDDYTPTTEEVATYYGMGWFAEEDAEVQGNPVTNFERWLSAHDAEVEARGLEKLADQWGDANGMGRALLARAQQVREGNA